MGEASGDGAAADFRRGVAAHGRGDGATAARLYRRAVLRSPALAAALANLGALARPGDAGAAARLYRRATMLEPLVGAAHYGLANIRLSEGAHDAAAALLRRAVAVEPTMAVAWNNLALAAYAREDDRAARMAGRCAVVLAPDRAGAWNNAGLPERRAGSEQAAAAAFRRAVLLAPGLADALANLGVMEKAAGRLARARLLFAAALAARPGHQDATASLGFLDLLEGRLAEGWRRFEQRLQRPAYGLGERAPLWDGGPLAGRTLLVEAEAGFGDTIQMARFVATVRERAGPGRIVVRCQPQLVRLFATLAGPDGLCSTEEARPPADLHVPIMSLPARLAVAGEPFPGAVPYLAPPPAVAVPELGPGFKVGLVWSGNPRYVNDRQRSCPFEALAPLLALDGPRFFALQAGPQAARRHPAVAALGAGFADFADTAAALAAIDLLVSVDTAVAHLAGALGRPAWIMLAAVPDWRWRLGREDTPWYPTVRLFRQRRAGDWDELIGRVAARLREAARLSPTP